MSIELTNLHKRLGDREVLRGVSLSIASGDVVVILGPNGSGKSTLLKILAGIWEPDAGHVRIHGSDLADGGVAARAQLGYVPDTSDPLPLLLVAELCSLVSALKQAPLPSLAQQQQLGVHSFWNQRLETLSFGQRKRACLLAALIGHPKLLILDEPSNGIDPDGIAMICDVIAEQRRSGTAVVVSTNDQPFAASLAGRMVRIQEGVLVDS